MFDPAAVPPLARLAALRLDAGAATRFAADLGRVVAWAAELGDGYAAPPPADVVAATRVDLVVPTDPEPLRAAFPDRVGDFARVPTVIGEAP